MKKLNLLVMFTFLMLSGAFAQMTCYNVVGYFPSWVSGGNYYITSPSQIDYSKYTHICYAFAIPGSDGNIGSVENASALIDLVSRGHANNVKVLLSIGGWLTSSPDNTPFESIANSSTAINQLATACYNLVNTYNLDGIDIDWEYPTSKTKWNNLVTVLAAKIHGMGKLFTAAVAESSYYGDNYDNVSMVDLLNIMCYGPYSMASDAMVYWTARGVPQGKRMLGVPFYSSDNNTAEHIQKANLAKTTAGGIMIWDIASEYGDINSIDNTLGAICKGSTPVPDNLALNKPVTVSSTENTTYVAANAVDNSYSTRWSSAYSDPQWIMVDLGATYNVSRVKITWEAAYASEYQIQVSNDASTWTSIFSTTTGTGGINDLTVSGTGRYIRMYGTKRGTTYGYSIWVFEVYGTTVSSNLALNKIANSSSIETAGFEPYKAFDGDAVTTRWSSSYADNQWISVDLGAAQNISRVVLKWEAAYASSYRIETSSDNINWAVQKTITSGAGGMEDISFPTVNARYVRMYGLKRATVYGFSLWEFEVYAAPTSSNLALNQVANASSIEVTGFEPSKAFDGNTTTTRWSSSYADNQWILVDLGSTKNISEIVLKWEVAYASSYRIETSTDNVNWTVQKTITAGAGGTEDINLPPVNARYVRMYGLTRATQYGFSLWEFEVYGSTVKSELSNPENTSPVNMDAYPNPATGNLTVAFKGITSQGILRIYNITGRIVYISTITKDTNIIQPDVSKWAKGIYIISLKSEQGDIQKKIVVE